MRLLSSGCPHFAKLLTIFSLATLVITGCTPPATTAPTQGPVTTAPEATQAPQASGEILMYVNVGETRPYEEVIGPIVRERFNGTLLIQERNSLEMVTALLAQGANPEVSLACGIVGGDFATGLDSGVYAALDYSRLPNAEGLFDIATEAPFGEYGIASYSGGIMLQYYTPVFEENNWDPPTSLYDLADPRFADHVALVSTRSGVGVMFLDLISKAEGAPRGVIDPGIEFAKELVDAGQVHSFPTRSSEINELMGRGEIWISAQWGPGGLQYAKEGGPVNAVVPEEGGLILPHGCVIPQNAPNPDLAYEVLNLVLGEEFQTAFVIDRMSFPMRPVELPAEIAAVIPHTAEAYASLRQPDADEWLEFREEWHNRWIREVEGGTP